MWLEFLKYYLLILIHMISDLLLMNVSLCLLHSYGLLLLLHYVMKRVVVLAEIIGESCLPPNARLL